jgi:UbiD family decarboxylase
MCIVVDPDIDIHDLNTVWWSFLTRGDLDKRTHVFPGLPGVENSNYLISGYIGIDATMPLGRPLERATTPGENEIDLGDYLAN